MMGLGSLLRFPATPCSRFFFEVLIFNERARGRIWGMMPLPAFSLKF